MVGLAGAAGAVRVPDVVNVDPGFGEFGTDNGENTRAIVVDEAHDVALRRHVELVEVVNA